MNNEEYRMQTVGVVVEDPSFRETYFILYREDEGAMLNTLYFGTESEADRIFEEYRHSGSLYLPQINTAYMKELKPIFMLKGKTESAVRKEFRSIPLPKNPNVDK